MEDEKSHDLTGIRKPLEEVDLALYDAQDALAFLVWDRIRDQVVPPEKRKESNARGLMLRGETAMTKVEEAVTLARKELQHVMTSPHMLFSNIQAIGNVEYSNPGVFVTLSPMVMEVLVDVMASEIVDPQELDQGDEWSSTKRQFWVAPPWEWSHNGYAPRADEPERATQCYLCGVEDGNATPYDPEQHHLCVMCAAKLWGLATRGAGIVFQMRGVTVAVTHGPGYDPGEASDGSPMLIYPSPN